MAPQRINILVGTPCYGGNLTSAFLLSLLDLQKSCDRRGIGIELMTLAGESLIPRGRNTIVASFLDRPEFTHLFFLDADIGFASAQVFRMLDFDRDVVCGVYPLKSIDWERVRATAARNPANLETAALRYALSGRDPTAATTRMQGVNGFARSDYGASGFMLIRRAVLERMRDAYPDLKYAHSHFVSPGQKPTGNLYAFFDCEIDPETRVYLSEDYLFCRRWTATGGEIWVDLTSKLDHVGTHAFRGNFVTQLNSSTSGGLATPPQNPRPE
ncbi:MAG TPA: hypothetical protein VHA10_00560 [Hypericibacter adhaerens]|jgi:hypothetical protein|uniref:Glycosyl transferase n=1 Tax=Hypericibacter adhaerens TaxID=2602016 RepID=A0A5J6N0S9_9PROT|nr:hypothetical protein [Hypericibacter adhaerens]QEX23592.1 hypothetical protein FRZ61_35300 [Hypericibacter adhaerens]HWA41672.1 hypothetical protein [Hypericibacter adhaerens]